MKRNLGANLAWPKARTRFMQEFVVMSLNAMEIQVTVVTVRGFVS